jgi:hypothetical protein
VVSCTLLPLYPPETALQYLLYRRIGGLQSRPDVMEKRKFLDTIPNNL